MSKAKKHSPVKKTPDVSNDSQLSPMQKQAMLKLKTRLDAQNRFKLHENKETGRMEPKEEKPALAKIQLLEATGMVDGDAASRLLSQVITTQTGSDKLEYANAAIAMLQGINPQDELEGILAGQMVAVHNMAMEYARRAMNGDNTFDHNDRYINRTTKLMNVFTRQMETLQKYRSKGQQKITVQHVQVSEGGQAIIGDVHQGGGESDDRKK